MRKAFLKPGVLLLAVIVLLGVVFYTGCNKKLNNDNQSESSDEMYECYNIDVEKDKDKMIKEIGFDGWSQSEFKEEGMGDKQCTVRGTVYNLSYCESSIPLYRSGIVDYYEDENKIKIRFSRETGEFVGIDYMNTAFFDAEDSLPDIEDPKGTAVSLATEIASQYVDDISQYTMTVTEYSKDYGVVFTKHINGYPTSDYVSIFISSKGVVGRISLGDIGVFEGLIFNVDSAKLSNSISNKVYSTYSQTDYQIVCYGIDKQTLAVTPDGDLCISSLVAVTLPNGMKTGIVILTILEKNVK